MKLMQWRLKGGQRELWICPVRIWQRYSATTYHVPELSPTNAKGWATYQSLLSQGWELIATNLEDL